VDDDSKNVLQEDTVATVADADMLMFALTETFIVLRVCVELICANITKCFKFKLQYVSQFCICTAKLRSLNLKQLWKVIELSAVLWVPQSIKINLHTSKYEIIIGQFS